MLVLLVGMSGMETETEANLHVNQFASQSLDEIAGEKNLIPLECGQRMEELIQSSPFASPSGVQPKKKAKPRVRGKRHSDNEYLLATATTEFIHEKIVRAVE